MKHRSLLLLFALLLSVLLLPGVSAAEHAKTDTAQRGKPTAKNVAVFEPLYGQETYTDRYEAIGQAVAQALGGTCTVYRGTEATVDSIASALQTCAVVIVDSDGATDYAEGDDCVTHAHTSAICLQTDEGVTEDDRAYEIGDDDIRFRHFWKDGGRFFADGTVIANHMSAQAPNSLLWLSVHLSMATDGLCRPLREKGVQTVYGYSQMILASGDAAFADVFFGAIRMGATVKSAISLMKRTCGNWDPAAGAQTPDEAAEKYAAYPVVVSDEDPHPGKGHADAIQLVRSKWKAKEPTFLYGDVNGDNTLDSADAAAVLRTVVRLGTLQNDGLLTADVNVDCRITSADAALILRRAAGCISKLPADD